MNDEHNQHDNLENSAEEKDVRKSHLKKVLKETQDLGDKLAKSGRNTTEFGTRISDEARIFSKALPFLPPNADHESLIETWETSKNRARDLFGPLADKLSLVSSTSSSSSTTVSITEIRRGLIVGSSYYEPDLVQIESEYLSALGGIETNANKLSETIVNLGVDNSVPGSKKPTELLNDSIEAYIAPINDANPASSSLIPIRECLIIVLNNLLNKRPKQEDTKSSVRYKVISIGKQLSIAGISHTEIIGWADQWKSIHGELSSSKTRVISRDEWSSLLQKALVFFTGVLEGLDKTKFKS